jgi:hypothetical protein
VKKLILTFIIFIIIVNFCYALTEEEIFNENSNRLSLYSLSNNIGEIEKAFTTRTGKIVKLSDVGWDLSPNISSNVKNVMNRLNLNYSMTTYIEFGTSRVIIVYRRVGEQWFIYRRSVYDSDS